MKQNSIIASIFIPSIIPLILNKNEILFIPIDKGINIYVSKGNTINFIPKINLNFKNLIVKYYKEIFKKKKYKLEIVYETPLSWEYNTFIGTIIGFKILTEFFNKRKIYIKEIINNIIKLLKKEKILKILILPYRFRKISYFNLNLNKITEKNINLENKILISINKKIEKSIISNKNILFDFKKEKVTKKIYKICLENCDFILLNSKSLNKILEILIEKIEPEKILISRIYTEGIKLYYY